MNVRLVSITSDPEAFIAYIARVSNPENQNNPDYTKLVKFLIRNHHWSPFEHAFMTLEIKTSRAIAAQILRHRSFSFQEFSQRYSEITEFEPIELRKQATKNRQSSLETFDPIVIRHERDSQSGDVTASEVVDDALNTAKWTYHQLIHAGVAKEVARMVLPLTTQTTLYMSGTVRSWIHYIQLRTKDDVQKEHRLIALEIQKVFNLYFPTVAEALAQLEKEQSDKELLYKLYKEAKLTIPEEML
jgi:thymidylate synthase (FAD)